MKKIIISSLLLFVTLISRAQTDIYLGYGFHSTPKNVNGFTFLDGRNIFEQIESKKDRRSELLISLPIKNFRLETGLSHMNIVYNEAYGEGYQQTGDFNGISNIYRNNVAMFQVPIRLAKRLSLKRWLNISPFAGFSVSYNIFDNSLQSAGSTGAGFGNINRYQISNSEERQAKLSVLADMGIRTEIRLLDNLWFYAAGLYQHGLNEVHRADFRYEFYDTAEAPETLVRSTDFNVNSYATNLSLNFGLRYMLGQQKTKRQTYGE